MLKPGRLADLADQRRRRGRHESPARFDGLGHSSCETRHVRGERWNSNLHAFEMLLSLAPDGAQRGLDVGCGEGETTRRLRRRVPSVVGLDRDLPSIAEAREYDDDIEYIVGDFRSADLREASFDVVSAVAVLHHVDQAEGLAQLRRLGKPGGILLVVGLARSHSPRDFARDAFDSVALRRHTLFKGHWETPSPKVWPPALTYSETRKVSLDVLPGARFRRLPYFRYGLDWSPSRTESPSERRFLPITGPGPMRR